ncbi:MAG: SRPBCC family protein [Gemmatimonadaceae bacterium]
MKRISASMTVAVPAELCFAVCRDSHTDERWRDAYRALRPGREYSGRVVASDAGQRLVITVAALDSTTGAQVPALGYHITYDFAAAGEGRTRVEISIEYEMLAAMAGMGTFQGQAENEILHRAAALVALEAGYTAARAPAV